MKHLYSLLLAICLLGTSCSSDNDTPASDPLVGTVWSQTTGNRTDTFYFALNGKCTTEWKIGELDPVRQEYRYTFKSPDVTIDTGTSKYTGRIENEVLSIHIFDRDLALQKVR